MGRHVLTEEVGKVFHVIDPMNGVLENGQLKKLSVKKVEGVEADAGEERATFFRIVLTGGYKVVEPKRVVFVEEPTIYILKVIDAKLL